MINDGRALVFGFLGTLVVGTTLARGSRGVVRAGPSKRTSFYEQMLRGDASFLPLVQRVLDQAREEHQALKVNISLKVKGTRRGRNEEDTVYVPDEAQAEVVIANCIRDLERWPGEPYQGEIRITFEPSHTTGALIQRYGSYIKQIDTNVKGKYGSRGVVRAGRFSKQKSFYETLFFGETFHGAPASSGSPIRSLIVRCLSQARRDNSGLLIELSYKEIGRSLRNYHHAWTVHPKSSPDRLMRTLVERLEQAPGEPFEGEIRVDLKQQGTEQEYGSFVRAIDTNVKLMFGSRGMVRKGRSAEPERFVWSTTWVSFTRRTEDPKLAYIESRLFDMNIPCRRNGHSFHAPILEVPENALQLAYGLLAEKFPEKFPGRRKTIDEMDDDDPAFQGYVHEPSEWDLALAAQHKDHP